MIYLIEFAMNVLIALYSYYFLAKVRFYPCIMQKIEKKIHLWSWIVALFGIIAAQMPAYSWRAHFAKDWTSDLTFIIQILVWIYGILLLIFHIKTTRYGKQFI